MVAETRKVARVRKSKGHRDNQGQEFGASDLRSGLLVHIKLAQCCTSQRQEELVSMPLRDVSMQLYATFPPLPSVFEIRVAHFEFIFVFVFFVRKNTRHLNSFLVMFQSLANRYLNNTTIHSYITEVWHEFFRSYIVYRSATYNPFIRVRLRDASTPHSS